MRVALISDLHGYKLPFEAVLEDMQGRYDQIVCLGDVAAMGPEPHETIKLLKDLACPVIQGNTDAWLLEPDIDGDEGKAEQRSRETELWSSQQLTSSEREFLRSFVPTVEVPLGNDETLLCYHGSPRSNLEDVRSETAPAELLEYLAGRRELVMANGHTHLQMLRRFDGVTLINPGSVGVPLEGGSPDKPIRRRARAEYAIVTWDKGTVGIEFRRVPVDAKKIARAILDSGMPHAERWASQWRQE